MIVDASVILSAFFPDEGQAQAQALIRDHVMDEERTHPPLGTLFALNMLVCTDAGDTFTFAELRAGLEASGFSRVALLRKGERMDSLVEARKPG